MRYAMEFESTSAPGERRTETVEAATPDDAMAVAELMARELGRSAGDEPKTWHTLSVRPMCGSSMQAPANDRFEADAARMLALPPTIWEGLLRAAQAGITTLGHADAEAVAGYTALKAQVAMLQAELRPEVGVTDDRRSRKRWRLDASIL